MSRLIGVMPGDVVVRVFGDPADPDLLGVPLQVSEVEMPVVPGGPGRILCGPWTFDMATGAEIDDELGWGPAYGVTGSFLVEVRSR